METGKNVFRLFIIEFEFVTITSVKWFLYYCDEMFDKKIVDLKNFNHLMKKNNRFDW